MPFSGHFNVYSPFTVTDYCIDHAKETQEPIFPPELKLLYQNDIKSVILKGPRATWYRPSSLSEILRNEKTSFFEIPSLYRKSGNIKILNTFLFASVSNLKMPIQK